MAFDATVGGAAATSYVAVAAALSFFADRLNAEAFQDAGDDKQQDALIMGTRRIDQLRHYGSRSTSTQRLAYPRRDQRDKEGRLYDSTIIPENIVAVTCLLALKYIKADPDEELANDGLGGVTSVSLGSLSFSRQQGGVADQDLTSEMKALLSDHVAAMGSMFRISR